ncbi:hypothetical protein GCM10010331_44490 [Streptomyces xanthochromogenes]|uniref:hypothetical protein n=1 Tax=Streptomyces xanthochromogenes TaxID=67384 RepID=UPI0016757D12|nr:hypothetical protein [Streptomyces xanthochromogenes]GHB52034.1 hypothetical protein GCM10010331_44490 [Streptomyces xanthochromogenes]
MPGPEYVRQMLADKTRHAAYGWVIDVEHEPSEGRDETGTMGPHNIDPQIQVRLRRGDGRTFRMYVSDQVLSYTGRIITTDGAGGDDDFGPLDDFGRPNAGCTEIHYFDASTQTWREL